jgi:hypothetical protein
MTDKKISYMETVPKAVHVNNKDLLQSFQSLMIDDKTIVLEMISKLVTMYESLNKKLDTIITQLSNYQQTNNLSVVNSASVDSASVNNAVTNDVDGVVDNVIDSNIVDNVIDSNVINSIVFDSNVEDPFDAMMSKHQRESLDLQ